MYQDLPKYGLEDYLRRQLSQSEVDGLLLEVILDSKWLRGSDCHTSDARGYVNTLQAVTMEEYTDAEHPEPNDGRFQRGRW